MNKSNANQMNTRSKESYPHEKRNLIVFALNQIVMRFGWMFKSESVVIPAFIDTYTASGTIRGLLPLILRIGQSLPQFLVAQRRRTDAEKTGIFRFHRVRFRDPVGHLVSYIRRNRLVSKHYCCDFPCVMRCALACCRLQSSG